jgi:anhydro-N-acetylmuramic acid kinase
MTKENYNVIGVMSGTSLDGIDLAHIFLGFSNGKWHYEIKETATVPYTEEWIGLLKKAVNYSQSELTIVNKDYTLLLSAVINNFISDNAINGLDAVCSHGHTILHQPQNGFTLQIGNLPEIARNTGQTVVCDFRVQDVELGGQGAPLVPIGDRLLFAGYDCCLNLGGFSNISFEDNNNQRIAFDISPVNTVLNFYSNQLGLEYDGGGKIAASGNCSQALLNGLNALEFYSLPHPKSLGFEYVKDIVLPLIEKHSLSIEDKLCTFTHHISEQLAVVINKTGARNVLATGGGAYNTFLIKLLEEKLPKTSIVVPEDKTIQFKEALVFALLGVLKLRGEVNTLASVTGAIHDHSSGKIYIP